MSQTGPIAATAPGEYRARAAIAQAAERTGVDFDYLLAQAKLESSLDPAAKARTSSATGLYQFINSTWLSVLDRHGAALGFDAEAAAITTSGGGKARIIDPSQRAEIMALRLDPHASALMAGALAQDNRAALMPVLGREPEPNELYLAHFLGSAGATRFLSEMQRNPDASAAALMPQAAAANQSIFHHRSGAPRSLESVYQLIANKVSRAMESGDAPLVGPGISAANRPASVSKTQSPPRSSFIPSLGTALPPMGAPPAKPPPMADMLRSTFGLNGNYDGTTAQSHARRAYERLGAFGL